MGNSHMTQVSFAIIFVMLSEFLENPLLSSSPTSCTSNASKDEMPSIYYMIRAYVLPICSMSGNSINFSLKDILKHPCFSESMLAHIWEYKANSK